MKASQLEIERLIRREGFISRRQHPELLSALKWQSQRGMLKALLPGIFVHPDDVKDSLLRIRAAAAWAPEGVITGFAAARISFWERAHVDTVTLALRHGRPNQPGFRVQQRTIAPEFITECRGVRMTTPALTALDLVMATGSAAAIDEVLRTGSADLTMLHRVLATLPNRRGNRQCAAVLLDSRDKPWSEAERRAHRLLRAAGLKGWTTNVRVCPDRHVFYIDIAFKDIKVAVEIDGYEFHSSREMFEQDRFRQNALVLDGWLVLRFTWRMLLEQPERMIQQIQFAVETAKMASR